LVPEGEHEFFIESISEKYSKKGRPMVEICLKPSEIAIQKYGKVWHYIMLDTEFTEMSVGRLLAATGRDPKKAGRIDFGEFRGEYLTAVIEHQDDERYGAKAIVKRMLSNFTKPDPYDGDRSSGRNENSNSLNESRERIRGHSIQQPPQDECQYCRYGRDGWVFKNTLERLKEKK
jgi:hypothetical protein